VLASSARGEGRWIGNRTCMHSVPLGRMSGPKVADAEVAWTERLIRDLACLDPLFRPYAAAVRSGATSSNALSSTVP
jgi:hypothetical protein